MNEREDRANSTWGVGWEGCWQIFFMDVNFCLRLLLFFVVNPSPSGSLQNRGCLHYLAHCYEHSFGFKMALEYSSLIAL